jgi:hypothetical protein
VGDPEKTIDAAAVVEEELAKIAAEQQSRKQLVAKTAVTMNGAKVTGVLRSSKRNNVVALKHEPEKAAKENGSAGANFTFKDAEEEKSYADSANEKATPDLSLQGRAYDRERPMLEKTIVVLQSLGIHFSYDLFRKRYRVGDYALKEQFGESIDNVILVLRTHITEKLGFDPRGLIEPAVFRLCLENAFNPVLDYLDGLKWDRKPRLDAWLTTYLGATEGVLNRVFGRKVLIAAVRRARKPGTKFDPMLVLEGEQDTGKSSAVKILAGDFFRDEEIISKSNKEAQELTCGVWLYEMSELVGLSKRDVEHVKNFLSRTHDSAREFGDARLRINPAHVSSSAHVTATII